MDTRTNYEKRVQDRSYLRYLLGLFIRWRNYIKNQRAVKLARRNGAIVGEGVVMPMELAARLNNHVRIGDHVVIQTTNFSHLAYDLTIGSHVIIGERVKIQLGGHNIDSPEFENIRKKPGLVIEDYVWLCPDSAILPGCQIIGKGAVIGANSVVVKDVEKMSVMSGWPAKKLRERTCVHSNIVVDSLIGGDYITYKKVRKNNRQS